MIIIFPPPIPTPTFFILTSAYASRSSTNWLSRCIVKFISSNQNGRRLTNDSVTRGNKQPDHKFTSFMSIAFLIWHLTDLYILVHPMPMFTWKWLTFIYLFLIYFSFFMYLFINLIYLFPTCSSDKCNFLCITENVPMILLGSNWQAI